MKRNLYWLALVFACALSIETQAQSSVVLSPSATTSLLTCSPGRESYSKFGHSAIRITDPSQDMDVVFNYGIFSFDSDHFYARFVKGETDYQLGVEPMYWFVESNARIGRTTYEQVLNLSQAQQQILLDKLIENYKIENRFYRYNFVFDNCATRPYYLLKQVADSSAEDSGLTDLSGSTYRHIIAHYSGRFSWLNYGINLIFGKDADREMTVEESLFLPEQLMNYIGRQETAGGEPFCLADDTKPFVIERHSWWISPEWVTLLLCLLILAVSYIDLSHRRISWWLDAVLFFVYAVLGCICCFLTFFSVHPLVGHNWNILFLSPIFFIPFVLTLIPRGRKILLKSHLCVGLYFYVALLVRVFVGQAWHPFLFIPIAHFLHIRCCWYHDVFILGRRRQKQVASSVVCLSALLGMSGVLSPLMANPRLTVVVAVEGLNATCIKEMRPYMPQGGLRLLDEEALEMSVRFSHNLYGGNETLATLFTGAEPSEHGITFDERYSRSSRSLHPILEDNDVAGIGTKEQVSPKAILSPTLSDKFRLTNASEQSKIYAVGIHANPTIIMAGHTANACTWLSPDELRWAASAFYPEGLPEEADRMNVSGRYAELAARQWMPRMDIESYLYPTDTEKKQQKFSYTLPEDLSTSPMANDLVVELALNIQEAQKLGKDIAPDLLLLELTVVAPNQESDLLSSAAQEDMYLNLNQNLGFLLEQLNKRVGQENYELVLMGYPRYGMGESRYQKANLGVMEFNVDRAAALCNTYLMAMYGHERWVDGGHLNSIYLNRTLIDQKHISVSQLQQQVSDFLLEFEGVQIAFPSNQIPYLQERGSVACLRNSYSKNSFGDVLFTLQPLWKFSSSVFLMPEEETVCFLWTKSNRITNRESIDATEVRNIILSIL